MSTDPTASDKRRRADGTDKVQPTMPGDEPERLAVDAEAALDERASHTVAPGARGDARINEAKSVLANAATRDDLANSRDAIADERERATSLDAFLHPDADHYESVLKVLRAAAIDRSEAQSDRTSAADDRSKLSDR